MTGPGTLPVRQVSQLHAHWQDNGDDVAGSFVLSVQLDDGAVELVAVAHVRDIQTLIPLLTVVGGTAFLDLERGALITGGLALPVRSLAAP